MAVNFMANWIFSKPLKYAALWQVNFMANGIFSKPLKHAALWRGQLYGKRRVTLWRRARYGERHQALWSKASSFMEKILKRGVLSQPHGTRGHPNLDLGC